MEIKELNSLVDNILAEQVKSIIKEEITNKKPKSDMKKLRKFYQLTEGQLKNVIKSLVKEDALPGLAATKKVQAQSKKDNDANLKDVSAKIKKATNIPGGDKPEFPNAHGKGEKKARKNSKKEQDYVDDNENRTPLDLDYDSEPSDEFKKRQKKSLEGDSTMGNGVEDGSNAIKTDTGKKMMAQSKKHKAAKAKEPIYKKEAVPVSEEHQKKNNIINEEVDRLKELFNYNKKTQ